MIFPECQSKICSIVYGKTSFDVTVDLFVHCVNRMQKLSIDHVCLDCKFNYVTIHRSC